MEGTVERLDNFVFGTHGGLSLEDRLRAYIDQRGDHKKKQTDEALLNLAHVVDGDRQQMNANHAANTKKLDRLIWIAGIGTGIAVCLQGILLVVLGQVLAHVRFQ